MSAKLALGVDIGGTNARAGIVDVETGALLASSKSTLSDRSPAGVVEAIAGLIGEVSEGHGVSTLPLGVGFAGMLREGVVVNAPNLGWREVPLQHLLAQRLARRVRLANDLSAAAWGEHAAGVARGIANTFTVFVGTGVGSAIIAGGHLVHGATGVAGEFGHLKIIPVDGRLCGCGQRGCLEAYVGGANLSSWMREQGLEGSASDLEKQASQGNETAVKLYDFAVDSLALAVANQVTVLNPGMLVLGGGVLAHCPGMVQRVKESIVARASVASAQALTVVMAKLGDDAGLIGAALLAQHPG